MATAVDICNLALFRTGQSQSISSLTENSVAAQVCNSVYPMLRDYALRDYPWTFATARATLSMLSITTPQNWTYAYALPADCLKVRRLTINGQRTPPTGLQAPYEVAIYNDQPVLYTDLAGAELVYTARVTDENLFDPMFASALSALIAAEIAMPLSVQPAIAQQLRMGYVQEVQKAAALSNSDYRPGMSPDPDLLAIRNIASPFVDYPTGETATSYPIGYTIG